MSFCGLGSKGAGKPPDMETLRASVGDTEGLIVRTVGIQVLECPLHPC